MCIIVVKPSGVKLPSKERLQICFNNNKDGAGFMYLKNKMVRIAKGYFTFDQFYNDLKEVAKKDVPVVMHFRIVSKGLKNAENTHPFPVTDNDLFIKNQNVSCKVGIAHNGTISSPILTVSSGDSDTLTFARDFLPLIVYDNPKYYEDKDNIKLIEKIIGGFNKLAILSNDGHIEMINHFIEDDGCFYSNYTYEIHTYNEYPKNYTGLFVRDKNYYDDYDKYY